jgi:hypothetical protein
LLPFPDTALLKPVISFFHFMIHLREIMNYRGANEADKGRVTIPPGSPAGAGVFDHSKPHHTGMEPLAKKRRFEDGQASATTSKVSEGKLKAITDDFSVVLLSHNRWEVILVRLPIALFDVVAIDWDISFLPSSAALLELDGHKRKTITLARGVSVYDVMSII